MYNFSICTFLIVCSVAGPFKVLADNIHLNGRARRTAKVNCTSQNPAKTYWWTVDQELERGSHLPGFQGRDCKFYPSWYDPQLFSEGQAFAQKNHVILSTCHYLGEIAIAAIQPISKLVIASGKSHDPPKVGRRYLATAKQIWLWYKHGFSHEDNVLPTSLENVRAMHQSVLTEFRSPKDVENHLDKMYTANDDYRNLTIDQEMWRAFSKDLKDSKISRRTQKVVGDGTIPISQATMAANLFLFVGTPYIYRDSMEIMRPTTRELLSWNHFWAVVGYGLGLNDEFNLALRSTVEEAWEAFQSFWDAIVIPALFHLDFETKLFVENLLKIPRLTPPPFALLSPQVMLTLFLQDWVKIPTPNMWKLLTFSERMGLHSRPLARMVLQNGFVRNNLNLLMAQQTMDLERRWFGSVATSDEAAAQYLFY